MFFRASLILLEASFLGVEIRPAHPDELSTVVDVVLQAWAARVDHRSSGHRFTVAQLEEQLAEGAVVLVAVETAVETAVDRALDGALGRATVCGSATVIPADNVAEIAKVCVVPSMSGSGVGEALMREAHAVAHRLGFAETLLGISVYQPELVRWYARFGYVVSVNRSYRHASPHSPAPIVMVRAAAADSHDDLIGDAAAAIQRGQLVGMPTETVYGLAADATNPLAVRSVFAAKGRPVDHPLIVHIASKRALDHWTVHNDDAHKLADAFWPGPLTMVLPRQTHVLDEVTGGRETVAIRIPRHPLALGLLALLGRHAGLVAPSANPFGFVSPTTADHVRADGLADVVLDGGPASIGVESTIVELLGDEVQILRPGAITAEQIEDTLGRSVRAFATGPSRAPGMMDSHYAPKAGVTLIRNPDDATQRGTDVGYFGPDAPTDVTVLDAPNPYTANTVATVLYARLREADDLGLRLLYVVTPTDGDLAAAVADRLQRAAHEP
jgi:L-threonylcarbamoyladenylate synthase